jgi:hypothetical protein
LAGAAAAGQLEDGTAALLRGDYPTAFGLLQPLAEQGDARARAALAGMPGQPGIPAAPAAPRGTSPVNAPLYAPDLPLYAPNAPYVPHVQKTLPTPSGQAPSYLQFIAPDTLDPSSVPKLPRPPYGSFPQSPPPSPVPMLFLLVAMMAFAVFGIIKGERRPAHAGGRNRSSLSVEAEFEAQRASFLATLPPETAAEFDRLHRLSGERPWEPIAFGFDTMDFHDNGFRLDAAGVHRGHAFAFRIEFTMAYGPVAVCEWWRKGDASDGLIDILAYYADVPRGENRFAEFFKTSAINLYAEPPGAPLAQLRRLDTKVFFELDDDNPEIYLKFDFAAKTGTIEEKDPLCRPSLVRAFHP